MTKGKIIIIIVGAVLLALAGCSHDDHAAGGTATPASPTVLVETTSGPVIRVEYPAIPVRVVGVPAGQLVTECIQSGTLPNMAVVRVHGPDGQPGYASSYDLTHAGIAITTALCDQLPDEPDPPAA